MKSDIFFCRANDPVYRAAEMMAAEEVGFVPVLDGMKRLVGVVTDRDLALRVVARRLDYLTPIDQVMSSPVFACKALDPLSKAEEQMMRHHKSRIPVIDDFGECVGIISLSDIAQSTAPAESGEVLEKVTARESSRVH
jgi:CBS domain-containing protein